MDDKIKYLEPIIKKSNRILKKIIPKLEKKNIEGMNDEDDSEHKGGHVFGDKSFFHYNDVTRWLIWWMILNIIGGFIMIFMVDMKGDGFLRGGWGSRILSAVLRIATFNSFGVKVVREKIVVDEEGNKISGGGKRNSNIIIKALYFLIFILLMSIMFPSKIMKAVENFSPMVPIFNTGTVGSNMNKNFNSTLATMNRMRSPTSTIDIHSEKQLEKITKRNEELNHGFRHMAARFNNKRMEKNNERGRWGASC